MELMVTTLKGLEEILAKELLNIGANDIQIHRRAVACSGDLEMLYKINFHARTAVRVLMPIATFNVKTADELYEKIKEINWGKHLDETKTFSIDAVIYSENFGHSRFTTYRAKDAIVDYFTEKSGKRPSIRLDNPDLYINVHISGTTCTISLDSSGDSLHKRGYRASQTDAPLNEVLAAGMLLLAGWDGQCDFIDPMCGSGTLLTEAAMIALNIPPGLYRNSFAFEKWDNFDKELFDRIYNDESNEREFNFHIYGSDNSPKAVRTAEANIKSAGLSKYITVKQYAIQQLEKPSDKGLIVTNPPYGERLQGDELYELYEAIGERLKHHFQGFTAWVISSERSLLSRIGLKPSKRIPLLNSSLECEFWEFELFSGKRKEFKSFSKPQRN